MRYINSFRKYESNELDSSQLSPEQQRQINQRQELKKLSKNELSFANQNLLPLMYRLLKHPEENNSVEQLEQLHDRIYTYRQALTSQGRKQEVENANSYEEVGDILNRSELVTRATQWANQLPRHLRGPVKERKEEFADILIDYNDYEDYIKFKKGIYVRKTADDFFAAIRNHIQGLSDSIQDVIDEINKTEGAKIHYMEPNLIIAWIFKHPASRKLGSQVWCISSSSKGSYNYYIENELNKQYFIWDFNYEQTDNNHLVGATLKSNNTLKAANTKNNGPGVNYVNSAPWRKHLTPLTPQETKEWFQALDFDFNNMTQKQLPAYLNSLIADDDFKSFKEMLDRQANTPEIRKKVAKMLGISSLQEAYNNNNLDIFRYIIDTIGMSIFRDMGKPLIMILKGGKKEFLDYAIQKVPSSDLHTLRSSLDALVTNSIKKGKSKDLVKGPATLIEYIDQFLKIKGE